MRIMARLVSGQWNSVEGLQAGLYSKMHSLHHGAVNSSDVTSSSVKQDCNIRSISTPCQTKVDQEYNVTPVSNDLERSNLVEEVRILYKSDNFVVVNKRYDLKVNSDDPSESFTVAKQLAGLYSQEVDQQTAHGFRFIHRLDYATSGCLCVALSKAASRWGHKAFAKRYVTKHYVALVRGHLNADSQKVVDIDVAIGNDASVTDIYRMCTGLELPLSELYGRASGPVSNGTELRDDVKESGRSDGSSEAPTLNQPAVSSEQEGNETDFSVPPKCNISLPGQSADDKCLELVKDDQADRFNVGSNCVAKAAPQEDVCICKPSIGVNNLCKKCVSNVVNKGDRTEPKQWQDNTTHENSGDVVMNGIEQDISLISVNSVAESIRKLQLDKCIIASAPLSGLENTRDSPTSMLTNQEEAAKCSKNISGDGGGSIGNGCGNSGSGDVDGSGVDGSGGGDGSGDGSGSPRPATLCVNPRSAQTRLILLQHGSYDGQPVSKVLLIPHTGRTHQLRVHCRHIGHAVVGDYMYSGRRDVTPYRMMLHSMRLVIPMKRETVDVTAPDPFLPGIDSLWRPSVTFHTYEQYLAEHPIPNYGS